MNKPRIIFMGTPLFGAKILECLIENNYDVIAVVCQPDKPVGRKQILTPCDVKKVAVEHDIPVLQPIKIRKEYQDVLNYQPDLIVTCAYGQIIPDKILNAPTLGCINVHPSLLPQLRGGAPIQHAILDGLDKTGVTIMEMAKGMDSGDIISQVEYEIKEDETYGSLHDQLLILACQLLVETMPAIINKTYKPIPQDEAKVTFGYNIAKEEEKIDLTKPYDMVYNQIRGLIPTPCCYGLLDGKKLKFFKVRKSDIVSDHENGYLEYNAASLALTVDHRCLLIDEVQPEGKNRMAVKDYKNGAGRAIAGKILA